MCFVFFGEGRGGGGTPNNGVLNEESRLRYGRCRTVMPVFRGHSNERILEM